MTKLILLHPNVEKETALITAFRGDCIVRHVQDYPTMHDLQSSLTAEQIGHLTHIAFVFHSNDARHLPFYEENDSVDNTNIIDFLRDVRQGQDRLIVDILTCNFRGETLKEAVETEFGGAVELRYSLDETGELQAGGNWVLESHGIDVRELYFTEAIELWTGVLNEPIVFTSILPAQTNTYSLDFQITHSGIYTKFQVDISELDISASATYPTTTITLADFNATNLNQTYTAQFTLFDNTDTVCDISSIQFQLQPPQITNILVDSQTATFTRVFDISHTLDYATATLDISDIHQQITYPATRFTVADFDATHLGHSLTAVVQLLDASANILDISAVEFVQAPPQITTTTITQTALYSVEFQATFARDFSDLVVEISGANIAPRIVQYDTATGPIEISGFEYGNLGANMAILRLRDASANILTTSTAVFTLDHPTVAVGTIQRTALYTVLADYTVAGNISEYSTFAFDISDVSGIRFAREYAYGSVPATLDISGFVAADIEQSLWLRMRLLDASANVLDTDEQTFKLDEPTVQITQWQRTDTRQVSLTVALVGFYDHWAYALNGATDYVDVSDVGVVSVVFNDISLNQASTIAVVARDPTNNTISTAPTPASVDVPQPAIQALEFVRTDVSGVRADISATTFFHEYTLEFVGGLFDASETPVIPYNAPAFLNIIPEQIQVRVRLYDTDSATVLDTSDVILSYENLDITDEDHMPFIFSQTGTYGGAFRVLDTNTASLQWRIVRGADMSGADVWADVSGATVAQQTIPLSDIANPGVNVVDVITYTTAQPQRRQQIGFYRALLDFTPIVDTAAISFEQTDIYTVRTNIPVYNAAIRVQYRVVDPSGNAGDWFTTR